MEQVPADSHGKIDPKSAAKIDLIKLVGRTVTHECVQD